MRLTWGALLLLLSSNLQAAAPTLRFAIADSWTMPAVAIDGGQPSTGILYDTMDRLAQHLGAQAEFHVLARARMQKAMAQGEVDVRCYVAQAWLPTPSTDDLWSVPLFQQRNVLVSASAIPAAVRLEELSRQRIGTVLSYTYTPLQPLFDANLLIRDDARNEEQVLQKLVVGRYRYAIASQWTLEWFNRTQADGNPLYSVAVVQDQAVGCHIRSDPSVPARQILHTLQHMKLSGEIDSIVERYVAPPSREQASTISP